MPIESILALLGILLAATWTPGPNNAMLSSSGARFGYRRTLPHILGVATGFPLMLFSVALGLGEVFERSEMLRTVMTYGGAALMAWLAFKTATAKRPGSVDAIGKPFTYLQAAAFQWINPKAWAMVIGVTGQFVTGENKLTEALVAAGIAVFCGITSANGWALLGVALQRFLSTDLRFRIFSLVMGGLIAVGVVFLLVT